MPSTAQRSRMMAVLMSQGGFSSPSDIAGLTFWWDFSDLTMLFKDSNKSAAVTADGDTIGYVVDKSNLGNHGWNTEATRRPLYKANIQNNLGLARFDGSNDFLSTNPSVVLTRTQPRTLFIVAKQITWTANDVLFSGGRDGGEVLEAIQGYGLDSPGISIYSGVIAKKYFVPPGDSYDILWFVFNGTNSIKGMNAGVYVTNSAGTNGGTAFRLGCLSVAGAQAANIDVGEVIEYAGALSMTQIQQVVGWLNMKWACYTAEEGATEYDTNTAYQSYFNTPLHTADALTALRARLVASVWGESYPATGMDGTTSDIDDILSVSPSNLLRVDSHTITLTDAATAETINPVRTIYVWFPTEVTSNGNFVIVHKGHDNTFNERNLNTLIKALVEAGYTVAGVSMPMKPDDTWILHSAAMYTATDSTNLMWFLDPTIRVINQYAGTYSVFYMTGISGGGWTTTVLSALDTRLSRSCDVAGTIPFYCSANRSDVEQYLFGFGLEYSDLYVLSCSGGRRMKQVLIANDPVTFTQAMYNVSPYEAAVQAYAPNYSLLIDSSTAAHEISAAAQTAILNFFAAE